MKKDKEFDKQIERNQMAQIVENRKEQKKNGGHLQVVMRGMESKEKEKKTGLPEDGKRDGLKK